MTPRQLLAWAEVIARARSARDADVAVLIRSQHYEEKAFKRYLKKLTDIGE